MVKQRLRLLTVSPALLDVYEAEEMTLETAHAFTVSSDHARQEQVWDSIKNAWSKEPYQIRRMLTEQTIRASDKRAVFVGLDAYEVAGGAIMRDLFQDDDGGWLQDAALLDQLVTDKLSRRRGDRPRRLEVGRGRHQLSLRRHQRPARAGRIPTDLTADERAAIEVLTAEYAKLETEYDGPTNCPMRSTSGSEKSKRRSRPSTTAPPSTTQPRSRAPASL